MESIVLELQREALDPSRRVSDLLRKALVVSRKLGLVEFEKWVKSELNGYDGDAKVPAYRKIVGDLKALNPYNGWIPIVLRDAEISDMIRTRFLGQSVSSLEDVLDHEKGGALCLSFGVEQEIAIMKLFEMDYKPALIVGSSHVAAIIDSVRSAIVEWTLRLEEEGVVGRGYTFSGQEKERAKQFSNINIQHFQGVLGDVNQSDVKQDLSILVNVNDVQALGELLRGKGVAQNDILELIDLLKKEPPPTSSNSFGPNIGAWIGKMLGKAASGLWDISVSSAGDLLTKAISGYFGLSC